MNEMNNERDSRKAFMAEYAKPPADLSNTIMNGIFANQHQRKASKKKEKTIMFIYVGAILLAALFLFFLKGLRTVSLKLKFPDLAEFKPGTLDLTVYYNLFIASLVFSLIAFAVYFVKSRDSHNGVDMFTSV